MKAQMTAKAAPGPWAMVALGTEDDGQETFLHIESAEGWTWGGTHRTTVAEIETYGDEPELRYATGALIAAAPDLYETLDLMHRTVLDTLRHGLTDGQREALEDMTKQSLAVLKKARDIEVKVRR